MTLALDPNSQTFEPSSLNVDRDLSAADGPFVADGDLTIKGSVTQQAVIRALGTITVGGNVDFATMLCTGEVMVEAGSIVGGHIAAYRGVTCQNAGDAKGTPTLLTIGIDEIFLESAEKKIAEIDVAREKVDSFRKKLAPLIQHAKHLTPEQREQLTELLSQAQEVEGRADSATAQLRERLTTAQEQALPPCLVNGDLYAGVKFVFPGVALEIRSGIKGPVHLTPRRVGKTITIQARQLSKAKTQNLQCLPHICKIQTLLDRLK